MTRKLLAAALSALTLCAQNFEVASIKPTSPNAGVGMRGCTASFKVSGSRVDIACASLVSLIAHAFRTTPDRITGPAALLTGEQFDIAAALPSGASPNEVPEMLQTLLKDRFKLEVHPGTAEMPVYALLVRGTPALTKAAPDATIPAASTDTATIIPGGVRTQTLDGPNGARTIVIDSPQMGTVRDTQGQDRIRRFEAPATTMKGLAEILDHTTPLTPPVIDMTGLEGRYQVTLEVAQNDVLPRVMQAAAAAGPAALQNVQADLEDAFLDAYNEGLRKLGLRLDRRKAAVATIVVDRAERVPSEN